MTTDEERVTITSKNLMERYGFESKYDGFDIDGFKFDCVGWNEDKKVLLIVFHEISDSLDGDSKPVPRTIADKAITLVIDEVGKELGDFNIQFAAVKYVRFNDDPNRAVARFQYNIRVVDDNEIKDNFEKKMLEVIANYKPDEIDEDLPAWKLRFIDEYNCLADRAMKLCSALSMDDDQRGFSFTCPWDMLFDQLVAMRDYLSILVLRAPLENIPIDVDKFRRFALAYDSLEAIKNLKVDEDEE